MEKRYLMAEKVSLAAVVIVIFFKHEVGSVYSHGFLEEGESTFLRCLSGNCVHTHGQKQRF